MSGRFAVSAPRLLHGEQEGRVGSTWWPTAFHYCTTFSIVCTRWSGKISYFASIFSGIQQPLISATFEGLSSWHLLVVCINSMKASAVSQEGHRHLHIPAKARRAEASDDITVRRPLSPRNRQKFVLWQNQILAGTRQSAGHLTISEGRKVHPISLIGNADSLFRPLNICASCQQIRAESKSRSHLGTENLKGYSGPHGLGIGQPGWGRGKGLRNVQKLERRCGGSSQNTSQGGRMVMMSAGGKWNSDNLSFERLEMEVPTEQRPVRQPSL
jgi:hypothetical protein